MNHAVQLVLALLGGLAVRSALNMIIVYAARRRGLSIPTTAKVLIGGGTLLANAAARRRQRRQMKADRREYDYVEDAYLNYGSIMNGILANGGEERLRTKFPGWARERDRTAHLRNARVDAQDVIDEHEALESAMTELNNIPSVAEVNRLLGIKPVAVREPVHW